MKRGTKGKKGRGLEVFVLSGPGRGRRNGVTSPLGRKRKSL